MIVSLNAWLQSKYDDGHPQVDTRDYYHRLTFARTGQQQPAPHWPRPFNKTKARKDWLFRNMTRRVK